MNEPKSTLSSKAGLPPGALVHIGQKKSDKVHISVIDFDTEHLQEVKCKKVEDCFAYRDKTSITWINIDGLHNTEVIGKIGEHFNLHPLMMEDILNTRNRPDHEDFEHSLFFSLKMFGVKANGKGIVAEQVSFVMGPSWIISFQEQRGDIFDGLRERIRNGKGVIRKKGVDYLFYRLIDTIVDHYFLVTENMAESIDQLEEEIERLPDDDALARIQKLKKRLILFSRAVVPLRDAMSRLRKDSSALIREETLPFLKDVSDHVLQVNDTIESQRDLIAGLLDMQRANVSARMNKVMQLLTIISTIFIPLTFIAGIYGMNFHHMPELGWEYGYPTVWAVMLGMIAGLVYYFKRKRWL